MTKIELPAGGWWDWEVMSWNGLELKLAASTDLTYHHGLELVFSDVNYVACPSAFHHPVFREPTNAERDHVRRYVAESVPMLVAFDIEDQEGVAAPCLIGAARVDVVAGTVFRYDRDDLKPGERLADWVQRG